MVWDIFSRTTKLKAPKNGLAIKSKAKADTKDWITNPTAEIIKNLTDSLRVLPDSLAENA